MTIEKITNQILEETSYLEDATTNFPTYTVDEAINGAESVKTYEEFQVLNQIYQDATFEEFFFSSIGDILTRFEQNNMIELPSTGKEKIRTTRLASQYIHHFQRISQNNDLNL